MTRLKARLDHLERARQPGGVMWVYDLGEAAEDTIAAELVASGRARPSDLLVAIRKFGADVSLGEPVPSKISR